jgi:DNA-binding NarL/FixJ family response regulator
VKALIVDDHPIARRGLQSVLDTAFRIDRVVEVDSGSKALAAAHSLGPDLVLLDLRLPGTPPSVLCAQLRASFPKLPIILITAFADAAEIKRCLAAGADGCLLKDAPIGEMAVALRAIVRGEKHLDARIAQALAADMVSVLRGESTVAHLTPRERQVLELLAEGCSNRMIAERLVLAETTVKGYIASLLDKLDASSRLQAVVRAHEAGLI